MCAEINTGNDRFAAFENQYQIDVIKNNDLSKNRYPALVYIIKNLYFKLDI